MSFFKNFLSNKWAVLVALICCSTLLFQNALWVGFLSDDYHFVFQMETYSWHALSHNLNDHFFIPLSHILGIMLYKITLGSPIWMHFFQLLVHGAIGWQIYLLLTAILPFSDNRNNTTALFAGLLFLVMPFQSEAVVWLAAKSYGYSLFFSLLSIRYYFKWENNTKESMTLFLSLLFFSSAILCKELAYMTPVFVVLIKQFNGVRHKKSNTLWLWIILLIIALSLVARTIVLGDLVGGYGASTHINISVTPIFHTMIWMLKYLSFFRVWNTNPALLSLFILVIVPFLFLGIKEVIQNRSKLKNTALLVLLFIVAVLPIVTLEITSFHNIQSERYGYFASVIVAIGCSVALGAQKKWLQYAWLCVTLIFGSVSTTLDLEKWTKSAETRDFFLQALKGRDITTQKILLLNIPDTYQGTNCMRSGLNQWAELSGFDGAFEIYARQDFYSPNAGVFWDERAVLRDNQAQTIYWTYPVRDNQSLGKKFDVEWLDNFDVVLYYNKKKFTQVRPFESP